MKDITLSLPTFLDILIGGREYAVISKDPGYDNLLEKLRDADPSEEYIHIQEVKAAADEPMYKGRDLASKQVYKIWHIKYWRVEYERQMLMKSESERTEKLYHKRRADIDELKGIIRTKMGLDEETATNMARSLYANKQTTVIELMLGKKIEPIDDSEFHLKKI